MQSVLNGLSITGPDVNVPFALTDATTILVDASKGSLFTVTLGGNRTMGVPSNPTEGQMIIFRIKQDGTGTRLISTWTVTNGYKFGATVTQPVLSTAANAVDYVGFIYNATNNIWHCLAYALGF